MISFLLAKAVSSRAIFIAVVFVAIIVVDIMEDVRHLEYGSCKWGFVEPFCGNKAIGFVFFGQKLPQPIPSFKKTSKLDSKDICILEIGGWSRASSRSARCSS